MDQQSNPHLQRFEKAAKDAAKTPGMCTTKDPAINFVGTTQIPETEILYDAVTKILYAHGAEPKEVRFKRHGTRPEKLDVHILWCGPERET